MSDRNDTPLVLRGEDGTPLTDSLLISEGTGTQHKNVVEMIRGSLEDFEEFGRVAFQTRPFDTAGGRQERQVAILNEEQATLLLTYMRNTEVVRRFKKNLVRAFWELRRAAPAAPELTEDEIVHQALQIQSRKVKELESKIADDAPKVDAYNLFMDSDGTYAIGSVAKMLGRSQNKLFADLRNGEILIAKGAQRNTPYQRYMHHFAVKAYDFERSDGTHGTSYTTRVQPSGIAFIARKLGLEAMVQLELVDA